MSPKTAGWDGSSGWLKLFRGSGVVMPPCAATALAPASAAMLRSIVVQAESALLLYTLYTRFSAYSAGQPDL